MTTLASAVAEQFERAHPRGKGTLLCVQCRFRKDRVCFRETPWYGRAACCRSCEGFRYLDEYRERQAWELDQTRERLRASRRLVSHLRFRLLLTTPVSSGDVMREYSQMYEERRQKWSRAWHEVMEFVVELEKEEDRDG
ncbi:hypothetical protein AB0A77_02025 [Streptomyces varsoviensis]|uniref:hypothetical protein n=1 Tax=Streptomyces varsoviensis TaxID=67373 RepID=UPI0033F01C00